jgi:hypothetical protein
MQLAERSRIAFLSVAHNCTAILASEKGWIRRQNLVADLQLTFMTFPLNVDYISLAHKKTAVKSQRKKTSRSQKGASCHLSNVVY